MRHDPDASGLSSLVANARGGYADGETCELIHKTRVSFGAGDVVLRCLRCGAAIYNQTG